jgi:hypothetical protein
MNIEYQAANQNLTVEEEEYFYIYNHTTEDKTLMLPTIMYVSNGMWKYMGKVRLEK